MKRISSPIGCLISPRIAAMGNPASIHSPPASNGGDEAVFEGSQQHEERAVAGHECRATSVEAATQRAARTTRRPQMISANMAGSFRCETPASSRASVDGVPSEPIGQAADRFEATRVDLARAAECDIAASPSHATPAVRPHTTAAGNSKFGIALERLEHNAEIYSGSALNLTTQASTVVHDGRGQGSTMRQSVTVKDNAFLRHCFRSLRPVSRR